MPYIQGFAPFHGWPTRMSVPTAAYVFLVILQPLEMFIDLPSLYNFISYVASFLSGIPLSGGLARWAGLQVLEREAVVDLLGMPLLMFFIHRRCGLKFTWFCNGHCNWPLADHLLPQAVSSICGPSLCSFVPTISAGPLFDCAFVFHWFRSSEESLNYCFDDLQFCRLITYGSSKQICLAWGLVVDDS
jgi:hypothetical protein